MQSKKPYSSAKAIFGIFITLLLASIVVPTEIQAQTFKVLHTFKGDDGAGPVGQLLKDPAGNIYGTTSSGGNGRGACSNYGGCGTAFKLDQTGRAVWVHSFKSPKGWEPLAGLLRDKEGNLYGTAGLGGNTACLDGCGIVFKLNKTGGETVLYKFTGEPDGYYPEALLVEDAAGNLYGTTYIGGSNNTGSVFKIDTSGKGSVLYNFTGGSDGCFPYPGVILDSVGNLYGVTLMGGAGFCNSGYGVVFKLDTSGNETVLHSFAGYPSDGANPDSVLLFDSQGNLYGTTDNGGGSEACDGGCGTVFELSSQNGDWSETVLYNFCSLENCTDGESPLRGPLVRDSAGNIYGTTYLGGAYDNGAIFKLDKAGKETILHSFAGAADGANPWGGLAIDAKGNLYGAATFGGSGKCKGGCGTVFKIAP